MIKYCFAVLLLLIIKPASAQLPDFQWVKPFVAVSPSPFPIAFSNGRSVAVDQLGNVYSAGLFTFDTDFDPGPGAFTLTPVNNGRSLYISKLTPTGDFLWAIPIPVRVDGANIEISVDDNNNVYLASEFNSPADFDPGPGVLTLSPIGVADAFVAKYDPDGNVVWAKQFGGPGAVPGSDALDIDDNNNVIVCGNFNTTVDFDPGPTSFNLTSATNSQVFIVKLTSNGNFIWAKRFDHSPTTYSESIVADVKCDAQGNIYTVGNFIGVCDFDTGPGSYTLQGGSGEGYITKLNSSGDFIWAKKIGSTPNNFTNFSDSRGIDVDANNNVYTTGYFTGEFDFDPGAGSHIVTSSGRDWYVLKLNPQGDFAWVAIMGGSRVDMGSDVAVDNTGNIYTIGEIEQNADMDPGPGTFTITATGSYRLVVLTKLNSNGSFVYAVSLDGSGECTAKRMTVDNSRNIYITGFVAGAIDFDPGPSVFPVNTATITPYVLKLGNCRNITTSTLTVSACNSYTLNNETFDTSGTYYSTIQNAAGCDSVITLHLTINKKSTEQSVAICAGSSFFAGGTDQTTSGTYVDTLRSSLNCDSIVTTHLTVNPAPSPNLGPDKEICTGGLTTFSPGIFSTYVWQDGSVGSTFITSQVGSYYVTVEDSRRCKGSDTVRITSLLALPAGFLPLDTAICPNERLLMKPRESYSSYLWSTNGVSSSITITSPGVYWLQVKDGYGCVGRDSIIVSKKECLKGFYMPNAFTPFKNGHNDEFKPTFGGVVKQYELSIYNRWGQLVFRTKEPDKGWDGAFKGVEQDTGVFLWICMYQLEGESVKVEKGSAVLVR